MKKYLVGAVATLVLSLAAMPAKAGLLEIRGGLGINSADSDEFNDRVESMSGEDLSKDNFDNYNADIFFNLPVLPFGVGLRHEWINQDASSNGSEWEVKARNISVIADWRILNNVVYVGPIVGIGYPTADVDFKSGSSNFSESVKSGQPSYSIGAEAGVKFGMFLVGAEAGYSSIKLESDDLDSDIDLEGFYGKAMVGVSFL